MLEFIYGTLASIGFTHPLHPVATHIPMGMTLGGFLFFLASYKWEALEKTAHDCFALALVFVPPTMILGVMDWQYRLRGKLDGLIIAKIVLACALLAVLGLAVYLHAKKRPGKTVLLALCGLVFITAVALGFIGGQLVFG